MKKYWNTGRMEEWNNEKREDWNDGMME